MLICSFYAHLCINQYEKREKILNLSSFQKMNFIYAIVNNYKIHGNTSTVELFFAYL